MRNAVERTPIKQAIVRVAKASFVPLRRAMEGSPVEEVRVERILPRIRWRQPPVVISRVGLNGMTNLNQIQTATRVARCALHLPRYPWSGCTPKPDKPEQQHEYHVPAPYLCAVVQVLAATFVCKSCLTHSSAARPSVHSWASAGAEAVVPVARSRNPRPAGACRLQRMLDVTA